MKESELHEKYGVSKKTGIGLMVQLVLVCLALALTVTAIAGSAEINRIIIYAGQALVCVVIIIFGLIHFKERDMKFLKVLINAYALFEAVRLALLNTEGLDPLIAISAKFLMAVTVANCALLAERLESERSNITAYFLVALEAILYVIYLFAGWSLMEEEIDRYVPIAGLLIAGSIALFLRAKKEQLAHPETEAEVSATAKHMDNRIDEELKKAGVAFGDEDMNGIPDQYEKTDEDRKMYEEDHKAHP